MQVPRTSVPSFAALDVMLDEALRLAEQGELMSPPTQPEIQAMRRWICHQVRPQAAGGRPRRGRRLRRRPAAARPRRVDWDAGPVRDSADAVLAADDSNRILAVSRSALDLLGFDEPGELVGRRLLSIIPERFHQAHIAGFTLHLVKGRRPLIGRRVTVPARRRDGSEVEVATLDRGGAASLGPQHLHGPVRRLTPHSPSCSRTWSSTSPRSPTASWRQNASG